MRFTIHENYGGATFVETNDGGYCWNVYVGPPVRCSCPGFQLMDSCHHCADALAYYRRWNRMSLPETLVEEGRVTRDLYNPDVMHVSEIPERMPFVVTRHKNLADQRWYVCSCSPEIDQDKPRDFCAHVEAARLFSQRERDRAQSPATASEGVETTQTPTEPVITQPDAVSVPARAGSPLVVDNIRAQTAAIERLAESVDALVMVANAIGMHLESIAATLSQPPVYDLAPGPIEERRHDVPEKFERDATADEARAHFAEGLLSAKQVGTLKGLAGKMGDGFDLDAFVRAFQPIVDRRTIGHREEVKVGSPYGCGYADLSKHGASTIIRALKAKLGECPKAPAPERGGRGEG